MRKVVVYIAMSLDGFIAKENNDISFLSAVERPGEDYGYGSFIQTVDTVVMGRKTYDKLLTLGDEFWHKERKCYVFSRSRRDKDENVEYYNDKPEELIKELRHKEGKDIFVDGGAELLHDMIKADLIDYYTISIIPVLLGSGVSLFKSGRPEQGITFKRSAQFASGLVQLEYARER